MKTIKITGVKKALGEYRAWIAQDWFRTADIMLDTSTGEVWTDVFLNSNEWNEYHDENVISLKQYIREQTDEPLSMALLKEYATKAINDAQLEQDFR